jgi:xanthine/CO dehydrogenase XdhC/CoxF family maturation factor
MLAPVSAKVLASERAACLPLSTERGAIEVLVEPILPAPHLFVFGSGPDTVPLVEMARRLGWCVTVSAADSSESRARLVVAGATLQTDHDAMRRAMDASHRALCVIMGHNTVRDAAALATALASRAIYIGVLGPRHRMAKLAVDFPEGALSDHRVHSPVGLDLGAETPEEIALSIASELLACLRKASRVALRQRESIHGCAP